jgi:hypothetical protein
MPKKYNTKTVEPRGQQPYEMRVMKTFWADHSMDEIMTLTPEELDAKVEAHLEAYIARQLKINKNWHFPESPKDNYAKIRNKKTGAKFN